VPQHALSGRGRSPQPPTSHRRVSRRTVQTWRVAGIGAILVALIGPFALTSGNASGAGHGFETIYSPNTKPVTVVEDDSHGVELGVRFSVDAPGSLVGIRFYKSAMNDGQHTGSLWTKSGVRLATATFTNESGSGWQTAMFTKPVALVPQRKYVASYYTPTGYYSQQQWTFGGGNTIGGSGVKADLGTYAYGRGGFPSDTWHNAAYYVDVLFAPTGTDLKPEPSTTAPSSSIEPSPPRTSTSAKPTPPRTSTTAKPSPSHSTSTSKPPTTSASTTKPVPPPSTSSHVTVTSPVPTPPTTTPPGGSGSPPKAGVPAGTSLAAYTGPTTITKDGTVIDAKQITQSLEIAAKNVVITRSLLSGKGDDEAIHVSGSLTISDSTISGGANGIGGDNYTATGVEVTQLTDDGFKLGNNVHVDRSWCHDLSPSTEAHADCGQMQAGVTNMSVTNSWFVGGRNSALFLAPDLGPNADGPVTIDNNVLDGGNYTLYCVDGNNGEYIVKNISITNNRFMRDYQYGPATVNVPITSSGNVWYDSGKPVGNGLH
jgi:hypothetical protein